MVKNIRLMRRLSGIALSVLIVLGMSCATASLFQSYTSQAKKFIIPVQEGNPDPALQRLEKKRDDRDKILYLMERGRIAQLAGQTDVSKTDFEDAIAAVREEEEKAMLRLSDPVKFSASMLLNDNAIPYRAKGYENVFLHHFQTLNYLFENDLEGAGVEVRCANDEQKLALERFQKELDKAEEETEKEKYERAQFDQNLETAYQPMDEIVGRVKNSFQNAYTFYISGLVYQVMGEQNDAYIDYKKAIEIYSGNEYLQKDVLSLAKQLGMEEDYEVFKERFPDTASRLETDPSDDDVGELVILFENGFVPQMEETKIKIPTPNGIVSVAFPIYRVDTQVEQPLSVYASNEPIGTTQIICDVRALAVKSLKERIPALAARAIVRTLAQAILQRKMADERGPTGKLIGSIYSWIVSNADLRAWYTLPHDVQILRVSLPEGEHDLNLVQEATSVSQQINVSVTTGRKTLLWVCRAGQTVYYRAVEL